MEVNLIGVSRTVSATVAEVEKRRGYLLLVSSLAAFTALPGMAAYCGAKAGVENYGNALRFELAHRGVGVGTAHPVVAHRDLQAPVRDRGLDLGQPGLRVLDDVRERLGHDEVGARLDLGRKAVPGH